MERINELFMPQWFRPNVKKLLHPYPSKEPARTSPNIVTFSDRKRRSTSPRSASMRHMLSNHYVNPSSWNCGIQENSKALIHSDSSQKHVLGDGKCGDDQLMFPYPSLTGKYQYVELGNQNNWDYLTLSLRVMSSTKKPLRPLEPPNSEAVWEHDPTCQQQRKAWLELQGMRTGPNGKVGQGLFQ